MSSRARGGATKRAGGGRSVKAAQATPGPDRTQTSQAAGRQLKALVSEIKVLGSHCKELERALARSRRANDEMRRTLANYRLLFSETLNPIFVINDKGQFVTANAAALRFVECSMRDLKKKKPWELGPPDKREEQKKEYSTSMSRRTAEMDFLIKGKLKTLLLNFLPLQLGRFSLLYVVGQDLTERRRTEQALRDSEANARALLEGPTDSVFLVDRSGTIYACNETGARRFGKSSAELVGTVGYQTLDAEPTKRRKQWLEQVFTAGKPVRFQDERQGMFFDTVIYPVLDTAGRVVRAAIVSREITELESARRKLAENESALAEAQAIAHVGSWESDVASGRERWSDEQYRLLGFEPGSVEPTFELFKSLVHPDDRGRLLYLNTDSVARPEPFETEFRVLRPDGELRWVHAKVRVFADETGRSIRAAGTNLDITERKQAEERAAEAQAVANTLFDSPTDAVFLVSADGAYIDCNEVGAGMLGMTPAEVRGKTRSDLMSSEAAADQARRVELVVKNGMPHRFDIENLGRSFDVMIYPVPDASGQITRVAVVARDVTELKKAVQERSELRGQLLHAQKLESLGIMAGGIAHDFNNLLTSILGQADLTLLGLPAGSSVRPFIEEVVKTAQRAAGLTNQLLAYSGRGSFSTRVVDLGEIVKEMSNLLEVSVSRKTTLKIEASQGIPGIEADVSQLRQVVMNLVLNATESLGGNTGVVSVAVGSKEFDRSFLSRNVLGGTLAPGTYVFLEVRDTGCGMTPELIEKAFDPFFSTKFSGRGLGLATVLGIVKGHEGAIRVDSVPGKGTTFTILFPPSAKPAEVEDDSEEPVSRMAGTGTILLVDDEEIVRNPTSRLLARLGYSVLNASNGRDALELFRANRDVISAVILDLTMPEMSGEETFRELKRMKSDVKVILSSGYSETESVRSVSGRQPDGFLRKPYQLKQLAAKLKEVLGNEGEAESA